MKNLRNKNQPPPETAIQTFLSTSWDKVLAVYKRLADIELLANTIGAGNLDGVLTAADIDTIAKLNAILTDATLGDFASQAEAEAGASNTKTMTPLRVAQAIAVMAAGIKNNFTAVVNPTPSDDLSLGYAAGSVWINIVGTTAEAFRCADPTEGAAVWIKTTLTADELATIALSGNSDDLVEGVAKLLMTVAERDKLALIEPEATADQSAAEIEAGYNAQIAVASQLEAEAGMLTDVRRWTPERIKQAIATLSTGGLAWSSANTSITVAKNTGTVFYALGGGVTATLPATPAVGDMLMIANNDNSALLYSVTVTAGTGNEIHEENVIAIPSWILGRGMRAIFVCYDAGAIKKWHMLRSDTPGFGGGGMAVVETKTADYTASVNEVVPVNSTGGAFTITMPASAAAQARVIIMDVGKACGTNNVTLGRNGATFDSVAEDFVINQNHGRVDASSNGSDDWSTHLIGSPNAIDVAIDAAQVDARVVAVASGKKLFWFAADVGLTSHSPAITTTLSLTGSGGRQTIISFGKTGFPVATAYMKMPQNWDQGTIRQRYIYLPNTTNIGTVSFNSEHGAINNGGSFTNFGGTGIILDTTSGVANQLKVTAWNSSTIPGAIKGSLIYFEWYRNGGGDTFTGAVQLLGIEIEITTDAPTDD